MLVQADVRLDFKQNGANTPITGHRVPSTFGYARLRAQKVNNNDQFLRSNIDNEANKRNAASEPAQDMTPFRQFAKGAVMTFQRGQPIPIPLKWNNPHGNQTRLIL